MKKSITGSAMINHILYSLPKEYDTKVEYLQNKIDENIDLSLNSVMEALRTKYNLIMQRKKIKMINLFPALDQRIKE